MYTQERVERDTLLNKALGKALEWPMFDSLTANNLEVVAVFGATRGDKMAEIRTASDLEKTDSKCDVVITVDYSQTKSFHLEDYIALLSHLLRSVELSYKKDFPVIYINRDHAAKIDLEVVKVYGKSHEIYRDFFEKLDVMNVYKQKPHETDRNPMILLRKYT